MIFGSRVNPVVKTVNIKIINQPTELSDPENFCSLLKLLSLTSFSLLSLGVRLERPSDFGDSSIGSASYEINRSFLLMFLIVDLISYI